jgi:hypothetical protein
MHFSSKLQQFWPSPLARGAGGARRVRPATNRRGRNGSTLLADVPTPFVAARRVELRESTVVSGSDRGRARCRCSSVGAVLVGGPGDVAFAAPSHQLARRSVQPRGPPVARPGRHFGPARAAFGRTQVRCTSAAVGTPVVWLWGATSSARSARGPADQGRRRSASCRPCYLKRCPIGRVCMEAIEVGTVVERLTPLLATR